MEISTIEKRTVGDLGRIVIPKQIRKDLNINEGDLMKITVDGNKVIFEKCDDEE